MKRTLAVAQMCLVAVITIIALIVPAHAAVQVNDRTEIALSVFIPCAAGGAGEVVDLVGPLHTLVSFTINGNKVSGYTHFQPQEIVGVGETTGVKYQATGITQESFKARSMSPSSIISESSDKARETTTSSMKASTSPSTPMAR